MKTNCNTYTYFLCHTFFIILFNLFFSKSTETCKWISTGFPSIWLCGIDLLHACVLSHFSHVQLFVTLWIVASPLCPQEFSRQEYWSRLPCPPPGDLPNPGNKPTPLMSPALAGHFFTTSATWEAQGDLLQVTYYLNRFILVFYYYR